MSWSEEKTLEKHIQTGLHSLETDLQTAIESGKTNVKNALTAAKDVIFASVPNETKNQILSNPSGLRVNGFFSSFTGYMDRQMAVTGTTGATEWEWSGRPGVMFCGHVGTNNSSGPFIQKLVIDGFPIDFYRVISGSRPDQYVPLYFNNSVKITGGLGAQFRFFILFM